MNEPLVRYLRVAKELTGSDQIDDLIVTALKIIEATKDNPKMLDMISNYVETGSSVGSITHFLNGTVGFTPYLFQDNILRLLDGPEKITLISHARMMGISTLMRWRAVYRCLAHSDQTVVMMVNKFALAVNHTDSIRQIIPTSIAKVKRDQIEFPNGSRLWFRTTNENSVRGMSVNELYIEDAAHIPYSRDQDIFNSVAPLLMRGKMIMYTTPRYDRGLFYRMWSNGDDAICRIHAPYTQHPNRNPAWRAAWATQMGEREARMSLDAEFVSEDQTSG